MDLNLLRSLSTVLMLLVFLAIVAWAWSKHRRSEFDEAAQLPLVDEVSGSTPRGEK